MFKRISLKEWVQLVVGIIVVIYLGFFFSQGLNGHIYSATQGRPLTKILSRAYLKYVLEVNSSTMINEKTPIQYAIMNFGSLTDRKINSLRPVVKLLMDQGVDINARSGIGLTALHYAIMDEDAKAVEFLISMKADVNLAVKTENAEQGSKPDDLNGMTPLRLLEFRKEQKLFTNEKRYHEIDKLLKDAGAISQGPVPIAKAAVVETPAPAKAMPAKKSSARKKK